MNIVRSITELQRYPNSVVTVGTFDGVHLAHQEIVREVVRRSKSRHGRNVVVTFEPHPKEVVTSAKGPVKLLSTIDERIERLRALNIDVLLIINFTYEFSRLASRQFYERYVVNGVGVSEVVVGFDHMFGRDREAGIQQLANIGQEFGFSVHAVPAFAVDGEIVSSSRIRRALAEGDVQRARRFLGYDYSVTGTIVSGDGRGNTLGYPTANIELLSDTKVIPGRGVYVVSVELLERRYHGMLNIGFRPTVTDGTRQIMEVHIFELAENVYGERLTITFLHKLRDERKFASVQELVNQLHKDKELSLNFLAEHKKNN
jgi:riboflavin kinase/FMN adenylyltransferase